MNSRSVIASSGIQFGTSGERGLVESFTPEVCAAFTHAFVNVMKDNFNFGKVAIGIDNRPSSEGMALACVNAAIEAGLEPVYYGVLPTPALAYQAMKDKVPCIMVTGSHIPFDRNGLKFYSPNGEISKSDEVKINTSEIAYECPNTEFKLEVSSTASSNYIERYTSLFNSDELIGKKVGIYEHSSAGRDLYHQIFESLGAEVVSLERSDEFVPIDTEAVSEEDRAKARLWSKEHGFDAIFSTDGDGDRPLVADENGEWLRGDILGLLTSMALNVDTLSVPVSCNTAIEKSQKFEKINRTKIGSPYVIAEFESLAKQYNTVAGFEANGGYLLGSDCVINGKNLIALPTRDAVLPALMLLTFSGNQPISQIVNKLPQRYTASDRIKNFATEKSKEIIETYRSKAAELLTLLGIDNADVTDVNTVDGLRMTLSDGDIIHLRPSGNAPELRCYAESNDEAKAAQLVVKVLASLASKFK